MDRRRPRGRTREDESLSRSLSLAAGLVSRAKIVLLCADGFQGGPKRLGPARPRALPHPPHGLYDERRPGKPRSIEDDGWCWGHSTPSLPTAARIGVAVPWPTRRGCPSPRFTASGKRSISNLIARSTSSSPPIRSSSSTISSDSTSTHPTTRWALRRREGPDPGVGANPASAAPWARIRRRRHAWLHPSRHHHPLRRPRRGHRPDPGPVQATASSSGVSELSQAH